MRYFRSLVAAVLVAFLPASAFGQQTAAQVVNRTDPLVTTALHNKGTFSSGVSYTVNDLVISSGVFYVSQTTGNVGNTPISNPSAWTALSSGASSGASVSALNNEASTARAAEQANATAASSASATAATAASNASTALSTANTAASTATTAATTASNAYNKAITTFGPSGTTHTIGVVPDPGATPGTTRFLREDGSWMTVPTASLFFASGTGHASGLVPDPGATAGSFRALMENGTFGFPMQAGTPMLATDFVNASTPPNQNSYPLHDPWRFDSVTTQRQTWNDVISNVHIRSSFQHGGRNFLASDLGLATTAITGNFMNMTALQVEYNSNTDVQGGGAFDRTINCYGHGDCVTDTAITNGSGGSRGTDEHVKGNRHAVQIRGNSWGIVPASVTTDAKGQGIFRATADYTTTPYASANHDLNASSENDALIDLNSSKTYSAGNITAIRGCTNADIPHPEFFMCLDGDTAAALNTHFGVSKATTLSVEISDQDNSGLDRFRNGPIYVTVAVADTSVFTVGKPFTISSGGDNFEQPSVLAIGTGTISFWADRPHANGEVMTAGGAVGHGIGMVADEIAPGAMPGLQNQNATTLHKVYPIVASLATNTVVVWVDAAGSFGAEYKTNAVITNYPAQSAAFTFNLTTAGGLQMDTTGATQPGFNVSSVGNYYTAIPGSGSNVLPPPTISLTGTPISGQTCVVPTMHMSPLYGGNLYSMTPTVDTAGSGCATLSYTLQTAYSNPYKIFPMNWARSNRDPNFVDNSNGYWPLKGITASTNGYLITGSTTSDFVAGDSVELTMWWQQYVVDAEVYASPMGVSRRVNPGNSNTIDKTIFGATGTIFGVRNGDPFKMFVGTAANNHQPDTVLGYGVRDTPKIYGCYGPFQVCMDTDIPIRRTGDGTFRLAFVGQTYCRGYADALCTDGIFHPYGFWSFQTQHGGMSMIVDAPNDRLQFTGGPVQFEHVGYIAPTNNYLGSCDLAHRFNTRVTVGLYGQTADTLWQCLGTATQNPTVFQWTRISPALYTAFNYSGNDTIALDTASNFIYMGGNLNITLGTQVPIVGAMCMLYYNSSASTVYTVTYPSAMLGGEQPNVTSQSTPTTAANKSNSSQCFMWNPAINNNAGAFVAISHMMDY